MKKTILWLHGGNKEEISWEVGIDIYTLPCKNRHLIRPTVEHRELHPILFHDLYGKKPKKRVDIGMCITDSLGYTAVSNTTL